MSATRTLPRPGNGAPGHTWLRPQRGRLRGAGGSAGGGGFRLVDEPVDADAVLVNTCGFVEAAKKDSIDTLLAAAELKGDGTQAVVAVGCLAERYGAELATAMPEADAVLGFDDYADIGARLRTDPAPAKGTTPTSRGTDALCCRSHPRNGPPLPSGCRSPGTRLQTSCRPASAPASGPRPVRRRLGGGPSAPLKIASGCDRRCTFLCDPGFRGAYVSRPPAEIVAEARWLVEQGVREILLVSENSSSYGKDLGDIRLLERLLADLAAVDGLDWVRVSYLQPAEMRPSLIEVMASTPKRGAVLRSLFPACLRAGAAPDAAVRRRRAFLDALADRSGLGRRLAGVRSNVICGFPGETEADVAVLEEFLVAARTRCHRRLRLFR